MLSDELDDQMINGAGANDDLTGIFERLTNPVGTGGERGNLGKISCDSVGWD